MSKHSNCGCPTESTHKCHCETNCGCHNEEKHSGQTDCSCADSGAPKSEYNNQWVSPAAAKTEVEGCCKDKKK